MGKRGVPSHGRGAPFSPESQGFCMEIDDADVTYLLEQGFTEAHIRHGWSLKHCITLTRPAASSNIEPS
eukprot:4771886-Pyramimonas_sp.AAC.1